VPAVDPQIDMVVARPDAGVDPVGYGPRAIVDHKGSPGRTDGLLL